MSTNERMHQWWSLTYAAWLTMPRVMIQEMPDDWQERMAILCEEWDAKWNNMPDMGTRVQITGPSGKLVKTPNWIINYRYTDRKMLDSLVGPVETHQVRDPCPKCGAQLKDASGGGVKCPKCPYWFCF